MLRSRAVRFAFAVLLLIGSGCGTGAAATYRDYPPRGYWRAVRLYNRGKCDEYIARVAANSENWNLSHFEVSQLNLWSAECFARSGRTKEAINLWKLVVAREPESGIADEARARIAGHTWKQAKVVSIGKVRYPAEAKRYLGGFVVVVLTVQIDGTPSDVRVVDASPRGVFDQTAIGLVQGAKFEPAKQDDVPVVSHFDFIIRFRLERGG